MHTYREIVSTAYKSLEQPDFSFVKKAFRQRPYEPLIRRMRDIAVVEELIEAEDDVCFSYLIKGQTALWKIDLSIVGPFGIFVRLRTQPKSDDFLHPLKSDLTDLEFKVVSLLTKGGVKLMTTEELQEALPMTLYNTSKPKVCLYQALFTDREALPWEA